MNAETLAALKAGVEKWDALALIERPEDARIYSDSCELCRLFLKNNCIGCPVSEKTAPLCRETPWRKAARALDDWDVDCGTFWGRIVNRFTSTSSRKRFRAAAKAEADFLRSLIPEDAR